MRPLITMTAITGKPSQNDILEYLKGMKKNGIKSVLIYPRSGCEIEYLSQEWFDAVEAFIYSAKKLDMELWLYDDFNWPSGDAGGRVTKNEKYRLMAIKARGEDKGKISTKSRHNSGLFGEKYFPNLLSYEAVDYFITCTHEEYYKRFGEHFGKTIKGIFTDEPSIGYCCEGDFIPYYEGIEADYKTIYGSNFSDDLYSENEDFYYNALNLISNRFNDCYISRLRNWCSEHGIIMTGHLLCDNDFVGATKHGGRFLKNLASFGMAGIDDIETFFDSESELSLLGACEYASGENGAMAELFALGPCDMSYAKKRCMLYLASAFKIDHYFLAVSHMDMRGNLLVTDFFSNFNSDQPDFEGMRLLSAEAESASLLARKDFTPDFYIRYPFEKCINAIKENCDLDIIKTLVNTLTYNGVQWKFIDDENPNDAPIIELGENNTPMIDGKELDMSLARGKIIIQDENANRVKGIFVRKYNDNTLLILNLFAPCGYYYINGERIFLDEHAVLHTLKQTCNTKKQIFTTFKVKYCNENLIRTMHINGTRDSNVISSLDTRVRLFVRNGESVCINGTPIEAKNEPSSLSKGMRALYKATDTITLKSGVSIISTQNDFKYLPSVLICGDFACESVSDKVCQVILNKRKSTYTCGDKLYNYGQIELETTLSVPNEASAIELVGDNAYTKVYANERLIGERIADYIYPIDSSLWGKSITLKIVRFSSIAPMFGDVEYWDKSTENVSWRGTPSPSNRSLGVDKLYWHFN